MSVNTSGFSKGTKVLLYNGKSINIEDLTKNSVLIDDYEEELYVTNTYSGIGNMYKICLSNGDNYTVSEHHKLVLINVFDISRTKIFITVKDFLKFSKNLRKQYRVIKYDMSNWEHKDVSIHPFVLGAWLASKGNNDEIYHKNKDVINILKEYCDENNIKYKQNNKNSIYLNQLDNLKEYVLFNGNKHIPFSYRITDEETRISLLQGYIYFGVKTFIRNKFIMHFENDLLAKDLVFVAKSLGFDSYIKKKRIHFRINNDEMNHFDFSICFEGTDKYYGVGFDNDSKFLLETFDVVKNTDTLKIPNHN